MSPSLLSNPSLSSSSSKKYQKDSDEASDSSSTPSLLDFSPSDDSAPPSMIDPSSPDPNSTFVLKSGHPEGIIGSASADPAHPQPGSDASGAPITTLPQEAIQDSKGIISSGKTGFGVKDEDTLRSLQGSAKVGEGSVVGEEAKGISPEVVAGTYVEKGKHHESWLKKLVRKTRSKHDDGREDSDEDSVGEDGDEDDVESDVQQPPVAEGITALNTVVPKNVTGADVAAIGLTENGKTFKPKGLATDKNGLPVPTSLDGKELNGSIMSTGSVKEKVSGDHALDPSTSNARFHELFPQIPKDDEIIEDYRVALQRDILVQGRLYVSELHLAFRANIFGWETNIAVPFSEITTIEKRMTAMVIPNAIEISTLHSKHTFASFLHRDSAFDLLTAIWAHSHPEAAKTSSATDDSRSEMTYTNDNGEKKKFRFRSLTKVFSSLRSSDDEDDEDGMTASERVKAEALNKDEGGGGGHPPTEYDGEEYKNVAMDAVFPTSPELAYELMFTDKEFLENFLVENQKVKELNLGDWTEDEKPTRELHYIKPLNAPMGPKETLCNIDDLNEKSDPESYYTTVTTTITPDVPSGPNFATKTRTVITWSSGGGAHVKVTTEVEWTKVNRMLKGIIERSCLDGQKTYHKDLETAIRSQISSDKSKYSVAGASETEEPVSTSSTSEDTTSSFLSFLPSPTIALAVLVVVLLLTNFWTLVAMRHQARALHNAKAGHPDEVASAVGRVLNQFSTAYGKSVKSAGRAAKEFGEVKAFARKLESQVETLIDRLEGLEFPALR